MLKTIRIQDFAIIDHLEVEFGPGLNIISGETGAGKSIIMNALALILGERASLDIIRTGSEQATVEAYFEIKKFSSQKIFEDLGIPFDPNEDLIVRRTIQKTGKGRCFINDTSVSLQSLRSITENLVDLCSQHDQQLLAKPEEQLFWIDSFGSLEKEREAVAVLFTTWKEKQKNFDDLQKKASERTQKLDFLRFQVNEIEVANLSNTEEDQAIDQELKILTNAEVLFSFAKEAESALYGSHDEPAMIDRVGTLLNKNTGLIRVDEALNQAQELLNNIKVHMEEAGFFFQDYLKKITFDDAKLEELNARANLLKQLKRKYGPSLNDVVENLNKFKHELALIENYEESLKNAEQEEKSALIAFDNKAKKLSEARKKIAKKLSLAIEKELHDLNMERAQFEVSVGIQEQRSANGIDFAEFLISPNPGEPKNALQKIASGGELSRIMLALHNVLASNSGVGVYLFDEVDTGIGGKTAAVVGSKLKKVSQYNQVICITHLPQVASFADQHFCVEKKVQKANKQERTICSMKALNKEERLQEIARMLGGLENEPQALANAKAMINKAKTLHVQ